MHTKTNVKEFSQICQFLNKIQMYAQCNTSTCSLCSCHSLRTFKKNENASFSCERCFAIS